MLEDLKGREIVEWWRKPSPKLSLYNKFLLGMSKMSYWKDRMPGEWKVVRKKGVKVVALDSYNGERSSVLVSV